MRYEINIWCHSVSGEVQNKKTPVKCKLDKIDLKDVMETQHLCSFHELIRGTLHSSHHSS